MHLNKQGGVALSPFGIKVCAWHQLQRQAVDRWYAEIANANRVCSKNQLQKHLQWSPHTFVMTVIF